MPKVAVALMTEARRSFHRALLKGGLLQIDSKGIPSNADRHSRTGVKIALGMIERLGKASTGARLTAQMSGAKFEDVVERFLRETFPYLRPLRPGQFEVARGGIRAAIENCDQYDHLSAVAQATKSNPDLAIALGQDYIIKPDVVVLRMPVSDKDINRSKTVVDNITARRTSIRLVNNEKPILHASISCKWTLRSDRAQNARSEALNLIRNRKGRLPHIAVVTAEPSPGRIGSIALGTGDIDCVYHIALHELIDAVKAPDLEDSREVLMAMVDGKRLRDISDLPLDLAV